MAAFDTSDILTTGLTVNGKTILSGNSSNVILTISGQSNSIMTVQDNTSSTLVAISTTGGTTNFSVTTGGTRVHNYLFDSSNTSGTTNQVLASTTTGATWTTIQGAITWSEITSTAQTMSVNSGYIANNASLVVLTLPTTSRIGSVIEVVGKGAGLWKIAQNAGEQIHFGNINTTSGTGGYLQATLTYDAIRIVCTVADTEWTVTSSQGNITVV